MTLTICKEVGKSVVYDMTLDFESNCCADAYQLLKGFMNIADENTERASNEENGEFNTISAMNAIDAMLDTTDCDPGQYASGYRNGLRFARGLLKCEPPEYEGGDGWISLTDRRPEDGETVLFGCGGDNKYVAQGYLRGKLYINAGSGWALHHAPSHWMPLPEPPK